MRLRISALFLSAALSTLAASAQSNQTLTGTVSDAMCGAHHMMKNATAAQCTRECVKQGSDFALVIADKVYTLKGDKSQLDKFAGQNVTVKGKVDGTTITVSSISPAKS
jgi:hydroxyethylthiazole kinase-like sugar kinase family protein